MNQCLNSFYQIKNLAICNNRAIIYVQHHIRLKTKFYSGKPNLGKKTSNKILYQSIFQIIKLVNMLPPVRIPNLLKAPTYKLLGFNLPVINKLPLTQRTPILSEHLLTLAPRFHPKYKQETTFLVDTNLLSTSVHHKHHLTTLYLQMYLFLCQHVLSAQLWSKKFYQILLCQYPFLYFITIFKSYYILSQIDFLYCSTFLHYTIYSCTFLFTCSIPGS